MADRTRAGNIAALAALYFAQGIPFGFQATALPVFLRASGVSTFVVGDAADPRGFEGITRDAEDTARALAG